MEPALRSANNTAMEDPQQRKSEIHALQVHAFLDAADEVDVDNDTVEDLLEGLEDDPASHAGEVRPDTDDALDLDENDGFDDPEYNALVEESDHAWSKQEVRGMKHHLKEKGMQSFIQEYVISRAIHIPKLLYAFDVVLCKELRGKRVKTLLYFLRVAMARELHRRERIASLNSVDDAVNLIRSSKRILILTGAGISVSCGIPDFRSRDGLYAMLKQKGEYELDDPQQMFDLHYFRENPSVFYSFASQIYPSNFTPSPCHRFIKMIEDKGKLLRNYTQNIDTLERSTGIQRVLQCHGSFTAASCLQCHHRVQIAEIEADIFAHRVPLCKLCNTQPAVPPVQAKTRAKLPATERRKKKGNSGWGPGDDEPDTVPYPSQYPLGIMKPDITFFGEKLADEFDKALLEDRGLLDLLIVIGTSLKVAPVADIIQYLPHSVPQILINKTPVRHINPDIVLLGNADAVVHHLCQRLQWEIPPANSNSKRAPRENMRKRPSTGPSLAQEGLVGPQRIASSHVWLFEGAEGGKYVEELKEMALEPASANSSALSTPEASPQSVERPIRETKKRRVV